MPWCDVVKPVAPSHFSASASATGAEAEGAVGGRWEERAHEDVVYLGNARGQSAGPPPAMIDAWCAECCCRSTAGAAGSAGSAAAAPVCVAMLVGDRLAYQLATVGQTLSQSLLADLGRTSRKV